MKKNFNTLLANMQQISNISLAVFFGFGLMLVTSLALVGILFPLLWAHAFFTDPTLLHDAEKFSEFGMLLLNNNCYPLLDMPTAFWELPIKLQGFLVIFSGFLSFYVASYTIEWLCVIVKMHFVAQPQTGIMVTSKWFMLINSVCQMWRKVINALRKVALYITVTMATTAIAYTVWSILSTTCPM